MTRGSIAAFAAGAACLLGAAGAAGSSDSTITRQDSKAMSNARNATSAIEACNTEWQDYRQCRDGAMLNEGMGEFALPIGRKRGQVRVSKATRYTFTIDAWSRSGNHFRMSRRESGRLVRSCTTRGRALCPANGRW
jgi:hypothetical protein